MEYKILPPKKRKVDGYVLDEIGSIYGSREQGNTHCDSLPEMKERAPKTVHGVHCSQSPQQLKIQSGEASIKLDATSLVLDPVGEQGTYSAIERRISDFNENLHAESAPRNRKSSGDNNSCYLDMALVKTLQQVGSQDTYAACEGLIKLLNSVGDCSLDTEVFCNDRVPMKGSDEDSDEYNCPSMPSHKGASIACRKIWEGSMQFFPNTSVPILAFFKSGQKLFDISWSALVVIKGRLPLEDFKEYIKDIPRSRTRNLMVISLCWKPGSSRAGLKCLKEVVKEYEMKKQVALAQPSPDVSLYLYPWKEVITTPLVKCGYLEEKAVIADRSELLIGCVVWRRHQMPSISLSNHTGWVGTYQLKEQEQNSPTGKNQISETLSKLSEKKAVETLNKQGFKSPIGKVQNNSGALFYRPENRGAKPVKEEEVWSPVRSEQYFKSSIRNVQENSGSLLEQSENRGAKLSKEQEVWSPEQGFMSSIRNVQKNSGSLLEQSEYRGAKLLQKQEVWSPVRSESKTSGARLKHCIGDCTHPCKEQGLKFHNKHRESGCSDLPFKSSKRQQLPTAPTCTVSSKAEYSTSCPDLPTITTFSKVEERAVGDFNCSPDCHFANKEVTIRSPSKFKTSSSDLVVSDHPALSFGKFISEGCGKKNLSGGKDKDIPELILPMLEPSSVGKKEPSLPCRSESLKTSSRDLPVPYLGHPSPSKSPISLDTSHEPRRFSGAPRLGKILPPVPNQHNSFSRHFTFFRIPSTVPGVNHANHPSAD